MTEGHEVVVVGSGPAGLAAGAMLKLGGLSTVILDRAETVAASWRTRYDGFRLNTSSWFSYLPGRSFPRAAGRWPTRDALVDYYEDYARHHALEIRLGTKVERIERDAHRWIVVTDRGEASAPVVVVATGKYRTPIIPAWPGREGFTGELVHSADYRNAEPYRGRAVLVVGPGNSGFEIATQLDEGGAAAVQLSIRTPPHLIHRDIGPFPSDLFAVLARRLPVPLVDWASEMIRKQSIGDLSRYGLAAPPDGLYSRLRRTGMIPTIDGRLISALKKGRMEIVPGVERFDENEVLLADGKRVQPEVVIAATGYSRNLEPLVGHLGVLDDDGQPIMSGAETHAEAPGLYFLGFSEPLSGNLRQIRLDARRLARAVHREKSGAERPT
jgi:putative flavoprotein involved in K+ transport